MRYVLAFAGLATIITAAPIKMSSDGKYNSYSPYASYVPYAGYPRALEEAANKIRLDATHMKRNAMNMAEDTDYTKYSSYVPYSSYGPYAEAVEKMAEKMSMAARMDKRPGMMEEEDMMQNWMPNKEVTASDISDASMMAKDNMKRHLMIDTSVMSKDSATDETMMAKDSMMERSMNHPDPSEMANGPNDHASDTLPNNWYGKYEPYSNYGKYAGQAEAEAEHAKMTMDA